MKRPAKFALRAALVACLLVCFVLYRDRPRHYSDGPKQHEGSAKWRAVGSQYSGKTDYYSDGSSADTSQGRSDSAGGSAASQPSHP